MGPKIPRRIKRKVTKIFSLANINIALFAVLTGFCIAMLLGAPSPKEAYTPQDKEEVLLSINRIADSFELYNNKRFSP